MVEKSLLLYFRKKIEVIKVTKATSLSSESNAKKANLCAAKKERIKLPNHDDSSGGKTFHINEFLSHQSGIEAMLNTRALKSFESLDTDTYRSFPWNPFVLDFFHVHLKLQK